MNAFNESPHYPQDSHALPPTSVVTDPCVSTPAPQSARTALLALAAGLVVYLALTTLGLSLWLALVAGLAIPVISAWLALCGTLEAHEIALDALLDERAATLGDTLHAARNGQAYTGTPTRLDEYEV